MIDSQRSAGRCMKEIVSIPFSNASYIVTEKLSNPLLGSRSSLAALALTPVTKISVRNLTFPVTLWDNRSNT